MATTWYSVQFDTRRQYLTLTDASGAPLDLSGMTAVLRVAEATSGRRLRFAKPGANLQSGTAPNFTDQGVVAYDPDPPDVATAGDFLCRWVLTPPTGDPRTVPDTEPFVWRIAPQL